MDNISSLSSGAVIGASIVIVATSLLVCRSVTSQGHKNENPFCHDTREPRRQFESDKRKRDEILKNGYSQKKFEDTLKDGKEYDAIFIGSGRTCE